MKCEKCNNGSVKFNVKRILNKKVQEARTDFNATCKKCGWTGIIYDEVMDIYVPYEKKKEAW